MATWNQTSLANLGRYATLSADYYLPEYAGADMRLKKIKGMVVPLRVCVQPEYPITYGVLKPREVAESRFRMARIQNSENLFIYGEDLPQISPVQFEEYKRSEVRSGDIVIAIGGYIGPIGIICDDDGNRININRHLARLSPDQKKVEPYYLLTYLVSDTSQALLMREIRGAVQAGINLADLRLHPIFLPKPDQQIEVAKLVKAAELCMGSSRVYYSQALKILEATLNLHEIQFDRPVGYATSFAELESSRRSDAQHFQPRFTQLISHLSKFPNRRIRQTRRVNRRGMQPVYVEDGSYAVVNSQHLGPKHINYDGLQRTTEKLFNAAPEAHISKDDLLIYTTGAYIGRTNVYLDDTPAFASNHVNILRLSPDIDHAYMAMVFQSVIGRFQTQKYVRGSAQAELYPADIDKFVVPILPSEKQQEIGNLVRESLAQQRKSARLLGQAKARVEQLIEEALEA
jgi:restriction endonuclease S subunit